MIKDYQEMNTNTISFHLADELNRQMLKEDPNAKTFEDYLEDNFDCSVICAKFNGKADLQTGEDILDWLENKGCDFAQYQQEEIDLSELEEVAAELEYDLGGGEWVGFFRQKVKNSVAGWDCFYFKV